MLVANDWNFAWSAGQATNAHHIGRFQPQILIRFRALERSDIQRFCCPNEACSGLAKDNHHKHYNHYNYHPQTESGQVDITVTWQKNMILWCSQWPCVAMFRGHSRRHHRPNYQRRRHCRVKRFTSVTEVSLRSRKRQKPMLQRPLWRVETWGWQVDRCREKWWKMLKIPNANAGRPSIQGYNPLKPAAAGVPNLSNLSKSVLVEPNPTQVSHTVGPAKPKATRQLSKCENLCVIWSLWS